MYYTTVLFSTVKHLFPPHPNYGKRENKTKKESINEYGVMQHICTILQNSI